MSDELLMSEYDDLLMKKSILEGDIDATLEALKRPKLDYMTKLEYEKDIRYDKIEIYKTKNEINIIEPIMIERNILDEGKVFIKK